MSDVLTSQDVNEIADAEPGVLRSLASPGLRGSQGTELKKKDELQTGEPIRKIPARGGKEGNITSEKSSQ